MREARIVQEAIRLADKSREELQQIISARDPGNTRRYQHSAETRAAAERVMRVSGWLAETPSRELYGASPDTWDER